MMKKTTDLTSHPNPARMEQNDGQPHRAETQRRETKDLNDMEQKGGGNWNIPEEGFLYWPLGKGGQVKRHRESMLHNPGLLKGGVGQVEEHIGAGLIIDFI